MTAVHPPDYFEAIRQEAARRWNQLESDPDLAGPWYQLFQQVQSPRHVVSELLQNADDAEATEAWIKINDSGTFVFEHNGKDFIEDQFRSLCRFGYSNKRSLFTIGFRGIGFKSTFSLGSPVSVQTPTVSVEFHEHRFTEPSWISSDPPSTGRTRISVNITDQYQRAEIEENFQDWIESPLSLLFFRHIRCIYVAGEVLRWQSRGPGPVNNSEWIAFEGKESETFLIVRSAPEPFPSEALEEIRNARKAPKGEEQDFPPCSVELVLGQEDGFYVVLPTGGETGLPFSANAPFMLTPDRKDLKPPPSPLNRWLLDRIGRLAASAMIDWLANNELSLEDRAKAYALMPGILSSDNSVDGRHGDHVKSAFSNAIKGQPVLLTEDGTVVGAGKAIHLPQVALEVWGPDKASELLDEDKRPALCRHIAAKHRQNLLKRVLVGQLENNYFLTKLSQKSPPQPDRWEKLLALWKFVHGNYFLGLIVRELPQLDCLRIIPVDGNEFLHDANETLRITSRPEQCRLEQDWDYLTSRLLVADGEWLRFLAARHDQIAGMPSAATAAALEAATEVLGMMKMTQAAGATRMIDHVAQALLDDPITTPADWIRLAHIAAALGAKVGKRFRYATRDDQIRSCDDGVIYDLTGDLERILPSDYADAHLLHASYESGFVSCSSVEWKRWIESGDSGIADLPDIEEQLEVFSSRPEFEGRLRHLQTVECLKYKYKWHERYTAQRFYLADFDFPADVVRRWLKMNDPTIWALVAERLLLGDAERWKSVATLIGRETRTDGSGYSPKTILGIHTPAVWLQRLQTTACLPDKHGVLKIPSDLLRRTPETEPLLEVESFVDAQLDTERTRDLLDALGVGSKPHGPDRLLDCLAALALAPVPRVLEVTKWYLRLDQFTANCPETDLSRITATFTEKNLVLSEDGAWCAPCAIYLNAGDDDAPGAPLIMDSVRHLRIWVRLGVADRPTVELAIGWINSLPTGKLSDKTTEKRLAAMLKRHPVRVWSEVEKWLDLTGCWVPVKHLDHALSSRRTDISHMLPWVKQRVADLRLLAPEVVLSPPFAALAPLEGALADRLLFDAGAASSSRELPWLTAFGEALGRIELDDPDKTTSAREFGRRLVAARIRVANSIQVIQYFADKPAGTVRQQDIAWVDNTIFIVALTSARLARLLPEYLGRTLPTDDLRETLCYCYERPVGDVARYLEENFTLAECADTPTTPANDAPAEQEGTPKATPPTGEPEPPPGSDTQVPLPPCEQSPPPEAPEPPTPESAPPLPRKPSGPSLLQRLALGRGFRSDGDGFIHPDGSSIVRRGSEGFPWQICHPDGGEPQDVRAIDACLERRPIVLAFEIWAAIENRPERHSLILLTPDGQPMEVTGSELCRMRQDGLVSIFPAAYRLKHRDT